MYYGAREYSRGLTPTRPATGTSTSFVSFSAEVVPQTTEGSVFSQRFAAAVRAIAFLRSGVKAAARAWPLLTVAG